ncbi:hypothetical protein SFRURICE_020417 [Spodoptera frugiperda]|nr:hypothetical protein SFRURICE_020417 [Spodoptera frugiperda]
MASPIIILPRRMCPVATRVFATNFHSLCCLTKNIPAISHNPIPNYILNTNFYNQSLEFRQLEPRRNDCGDDKFIQPAKGSLSFIKEFQRSFGFSSRNDNPQKNRKRRVPRLILLQNPFTWLMIKIDFSVLRNIWDPSFHERDFKFGTKQAISRVTQVISSGQLKELNGLLTKAARLSLMRELDRNWGEKQRSLLALKNDDIQISSPRKVYFIRIGEKKFCDVDMAFLALKWAPINSIEALIFTEIFARFHREYTPHCIPEWTIAYFKVTRFEVLRR